MNGAVLVRTMVSGNVRVMAIIVHEGRMVIDIEVATIGEARFLGAAGDRRRLGLGLREIVFYRPAS